MANRTWLDASGDAGANANWGTAPVDGDSAWILSGGQSIASGLDQSLIDIADLKIGRDFIGKIASSSSPLTYGICTGTWYIDAPAANEINLGCTSVPLAIVLGAGSGNYACHFYSGTYTALEAFAGGLIRIGATATVTTLYVGVGATVVIDYGASVPTIYNMGGTIISNIGHTTIHNNAGLFKLQGTAAGSVTTINQNGGEIQFTSGSATFSPTVTTLNAFTGLFWAGSSSIARTVTTANVRAGAEVITENNVQSNVVTTANVYGGKFIGKATTLNYYYGGSGFQVPGGHP